MSHKLPPLLQDRRVRVIHSILRTDLLHKSQTALLQLRARRGETRAAHNLPASAVVALFAGSLIKKKGPLQVLKAADLACAQLCGCTTSTPTMANTTAAATPAAAGGLRALLAGQSANSDSSLNSAMMTTATKTAMWRQSISNSSTRVRCCSVAAAAVVCPHVVFAYSVTNMLHKMEAAVAVLEALPADNVHLLHPERQEHVFELYAASDVFIMNSECENFGMVTLEAMAHGLPVLATARCGTLDIEQHMETGLLHDDSDAVDQLAEHLLMMMHPTTTVTTTATTAVDTTAAASIALLYQRLVLAGRALFQERFSPIRERRAWGRLLAEVVAAAAVADAEEMSRRRRLPERAYVAGEPAIGLPAWLALGRQAAARMLHRHLHGPPNITIAAHSHLAYHAQPDCQSHRSRHPHHDSHHYCGHGTYSDVGDGGGSGGSNGSSNATHHHQYQQVQLWQPSLPWEWVRHADAPAALAHAPSTALGRWLYLLGGFKDAHGHRVNNGMWKLDMGANSGGSPEWAQITTPLPPRLGRLHAAAVSYLERFIYVAGGQVSGQCDAPTNAAFRFDTQLLVWQQLPDLPAPLWGASAVIMDGVLTLLGGATIRNGSDDVWRHSHLQLQLRPNEDVPSAGAWQVRPPPPNVILSPSAIVMHFAGSDSAPGHPSAVGRRRLRSSAHSPSISSVRLFGGAITVAEQDNATSGSIKCRPYVKWTNEAGAAAHGVFTFNEGIVRL